MPKVSYPLPIKKNLKNLRQIMPLPLAISKIQLKGEKYLRLQDQEKWPPYLVQIPRHA